MTASFIDEYLPDEIQGVPCQSQPRFSTRIVLAKDGDETRNRNWQSPLRKFMLPEAICDMEGLEAGLSHFEVMGGPFSSFPFRDPIEFASCALEQPNVIPAYTGLDQVLGTGDGSTYQFQLARVRQVGSATYTRTIKLPILDTIEILINGLLPADVPSGSPDYGPYAVASISRPGGLVTFTTPPHAGLALTWGGLFDTLVRWEADDTFDGVVHSLQTTGVSPISLVELRNC